MHDGYGLLNGMKAMAGDTFTWVVVETVKRGFVEMLCFESSLPTVRNAASLLQRCHDE